MIILVDARSTNRSNGAQIASVWRRCAFKALKLCAIQSLSIGVQIGPLVDENMSSDAIQTHACGRIHPFVHARPSNGLSLTGGGPIVNFYFNHWLRTWTGDAYGMS